ncbi:MAG: hypothetical protein SLRJCFUN_001546 [Candidatus Fervidibacter sp.]|jgi:type II secretory pathway component PulM
MRQEVPIWLVAIVLGLVVLVIGVLAYRHFMQTPTTQVGGEQTQLLQQRMQEAFGQGKIPQGMKVVPPAPPTKGQ